MQPLQHGQQLRYTADLQDLKAVVYAGRAFISHALHHGRRRAHPNHASAPGDEALQQVAGGLEQ